MRTFHVEKKYVLDYINFLACVLIIWLLYLSDHLFILFNIF